MSTNVRDFNGQTALYHAVARSGSTSNLEIVPVLIDHGADLNICSLNQGTVDLIQSGGEEISCFDDETSEDKTRSESDVNLLPQWLKDDYDYDSPDDYDSPEDKTRSEMDESDVNLLPRWLKDDSPESEFILEN